MDMKRTIVLGLIAVAIACFGLASVGLNSGLDIGVDAEADDATFEYEGLSYEINSDGSTVTLKGSASSSPSGVLTIPEKASDGSKWYTVTAIGNYAFEYCSGFTGALSIPGSVASIGNRAFYECSGFTGSLSIGDGVKSIGAEAFDKCSRFTALSIPGSVASIGERAFDGCTGFTGSLVIPGSLTSISARAFYGCSGFTALSIGAGVTSIGNNVFDKCSGFTGSLVIPSSVASIGDRAFYECSGFTALTIGDGVKSIGAESFQGCSGFTGSLVIPSSVTSIDSGAFYGCSGFTGSLTIGAGVKSIGDYAFSGCSGFIGSLSIGDGVADIGEHAFDKCSGFTILSIGAGVTSIGADAFSGCSGFTGSLVIPSNVASIGYGAFNGCSGFTGSLTIPGNVASIGNYAFQGCSAFTSVEIASSVKGIGSNAFEGWIFFYADGSTVIADVAELPGYTYVGTMKKMVRSNPSTFSTVSFDGNGGSGSQGSVQVPKNTVYMLPATTSFVAPEGMVFCGWGETAESKVAIASYRITSDKTFYALWGYKVSYDTNGGSGGIESKEYVVGSTAIVEKYGGTKEGFNFEGWSYGGKVYHPGDMVFVGSGIKFTAVWKEVGSSGGGNILPIVVGIVAILAFIGIAAFYYVKKKNQ